MQAQVPAGWTRATTLPAVPGLTLDGATGYTAPDGGTVMFGTADDADNSTLLPTGLLQAAGGVPEERHRRRARPGQAPGLPLRDLQPEGLDQPLTVYAVPTTEGVATVACAARERELRGRSPTRSS